MIFRQFLSVLKLTTVKTRGDMINDNDVYKDSLKEMNQSSGKRKREISWSYLKHQCDAVRRRGKTNTGARIPESCSPWPTKRQDMFDSGVKRGKSFAISASVKLLQNNYRLRTSLPALLLWRFIIARAVLPWSRASAKSRETFIPKSTSSLQPPHLHPRPDEDEMLLSKTK